MDRSIILLTYKGKVLLLHKDYIPEALAQYPWYFISGLKEKDESSMQAIHRKVKEETSIQLESTQFLGSSIEEKEKKYFFHYHLTDRDVNSIVRQEGSILGFFSLEETDKLFLTLSTKLLIKNHRDVVERMDAI